MDTIFTCSSALLSVSPLLNFGTAHEVGDVAIPVLAFSFPLTSPLEILLGKELRPMALPWPRAFEDSITWVDRLSHHFQRH